MLAILNSLNTHNLPIFQPILMILVSKFMVHRALSDQPYLLLGLLSPLNSVWHRAVRSIANLFCVFCLSILVLPGICAVSSVIFL